MLSFLWKICKWTITWTDFRLFGLIVTENYASAAKLKDQNFCQRVLHSSPLNRNRILQMPSSKFTRNWGGGACGMWSRLDWTLAWVDPAQHWCTHLSQPNQPSPQASLCQTASALNGPKLGRFSRQPGRFRQPVEKFLHVVQNLNPSNSSQNHHRQEQKKKISLQIFRARSEL